MKRNNILVTGASGFVGQFLLERLIQTDCNKIVAMHKKPLNKSLKERFDDQITWNNTDLVSGDCCGLLSDIDIIFHLAGYSSVSTSKEEIDYLQKVNVDITEKLAVDCIASPVRQFIFVSTIAVCENSFSRIIHETNGFPITAYGISKKRAEDLLIKIADRHYAVTILRPTTLFGEHRKETIYELVKSVKNKKFAIFGSGENHTNFYYIRDFIEILINVKDNNMALNQVFIASDNAFQLNILISWIAESLKCRKFFLKIPIWIGYIVCYFLYVIERLTNKKFSFSLRRLKAMNRDVIYSNRKILYALNVANKYGVQQGINNTIDWYHKRGIL